MDERDVAPRQHAIELGHVAAHLDPAGARRPSRSTRGPATASIRSPGIRSAAAS